MRDQALSIVENERAKLQRLFTQAPAAICILEGPEHRFAFANVLYRQIVGDRDLIGMSVREALPELANQGFIDLLIVFIALVSRLWARSYRRKSIAMATAD